MTTWGMAYMLEDRSGQLTGSEFIDLNGRLCLSYRCTARDVTHSAYMIFNTTSSGEFTGSYTRPVVALDFGPNNTLGTIIFVPETSIQMKKYLVKVSPLGRSALSSAQWSLTTYSLFLLHPALSYGSLLLQMDKNTGGGGVLKTARNGLYVSHSVFANLRTSFSTMLAVYKSEWLYRR